MRQRKPLCFVCEKPCTEFNKAASFVFTKTNVARYGHKLCFMELNKDLMQESSPYRWKQETTDGRFR